MEVKMKDKKEKVLVPYAKKEMKEDYKEKKQIRDFGK